MKADTLTSDYHYTNFGVEVWDAMRMVQKLNCDHWTIVGPSYPWFYSVLSSYPKRIDCVHTSKEFGDVDMANAVDILQTNVKTNEMKRNLNLSLTDLEVHVRPDFCDEMLWDHTHNFSHPDALFLTTTHGANDTPIDVLVNQPECKYILCLIPKHKIDGIDPFIPSHFRAKLECQFDFQLVDYLLPETNSYGLVVYQSNSNQ